MKGFKITETWLKKSHGNKYLYNSLERRVTRNCNKYQSSSLNENGGDH